MSTTPVNGTKVLFCLAFCLAILTSVHGEVASAQSSSRNRGAIEVTDSMSASGELSGAPSASMSGARGAPRGFQPKVGRQAAAKYMGVAVESTTDEGSDEAPAARRGTASVSQDSHYMAIHAGAYVSDNSYRWGEKDNASNVGGLNAGVTYRVGEWVNSMDLALRIDYSGYKLVEGRASKLSFLPVILFPDATSRFPLYFGAGLGLGVFASQVGSESALTLDYQLLGGVRFFDVIGNTGFFVEAGVKNHFFLLSDGQFNGTFATAGSVFSF